MYFRIIIIIIIIFSSQSPAVVLESEVSVVKYNMIGTLPEKKEDFQTLLVVKDKNLRR